MRGAIVILPLAGCVLAVPSTLRQVNEFDCESAAVSNFGFSAISGGPSLLLTTFKPSGEDHVYAVPSIDKALAGGAVNLTTLDDTALWPNAVAEVPANVIKSEPSKSFVLSAGGFFVSGSKSTGEIALYDVTNIAGNITKRVISTPKKGNFYHQAEWLDVDGDGLLDVIAARAFKSLNPFGDKPEGSLVWLKQPANAGDAWVEGQLTDLTGPGVGFALTDINGDGKVEVVATQFFVKKQLSIWSCNAAQWSDCKDGQNIQVDVIDDAEDAPFFAVQWVDLDGDGKKELLTTTNTADGHGSAFIFEQLNNDKSLSNITFKKYTIADDYKPTKALLPGRGSPGRPLAFKAHKNDTLMTIIVSGDDEGTMDLFTPTGGKFEYNRTRFVDIGNTIGSQSAADVNGDGYAEVVVPKYSSDKVTLFTFAP